MTVSYTMTQSDSWALTKYTYTHDWRRGAEFVLAALGAPIGALIAASKNDMPWFLGAVFAAVALVLWTSCIYGALRFIVWRRSKTWPTELRQIELSLAEDGVHVITPKSSSRLDWSGVTRVARGRHAVYLYLTREIAYVAPIRAFATSEDMDAFAQYAASHVS
jgi:hypothetical protein